jgi:predicted phage terminase large subunit-like protein
LFSHTETAVKDFLKQIKDHFTQNTDFRRLFPEHVPWGKGIDNFGTTEVLDTKARTSFSAKEHTIKTMTVDSAKSSAHYEAVFIDDAIDETNAKIPERIEAVKQSLAALEPLVDKRESAEGGQRGWTYFTGTPYDNSDAGWTIYEEEEAKIGPAVYEEIMAMNETEKELAVKQVISEGFRFAPKQWACNVQSAAPNWPNGPFLWPERYGYKVLKAIEDNPMAGIFALSAQYLMNPVPSGSGLVDKKEQIVWTPRQRMNEIYPRLYQSMYAALDLAGMNPETKNSQSNDYTVLTVGGFGTDGHLYIPEMHHGRPTMKELIDLMYAVYRRHPRIRYFKVPEDLLGQVLMPELKRAREQRGWLPVLGMPIDNRQSKKHKIKGLQPLFAQGIIHFVDDIPCRTNVVLEVTRFPRYAHDDILDTLHELITNPDGSIVSELMGAPKEALDGSMSNRIALKNPDGTTSYIERPANAEPFKFNKVFGLGEENEVPSGFMGGW